jgi:LPXTG-motif cell wall-anchored protein
VEVTTASVTLKKVDASGAKLDNAWFNLERKTSQKDKDGNDVYETVSVVAETDDSGNITAYHVADSTETGTTTTIVAGSVTIKGLDLGSDYQLEETQAPAGYNKLTTPKAIEVNNDRTAFNPVTVENSTGNILPSTGGIGTTIFFVAGGILVVGAMILLIARWRMKLEE